MKISALRTLVRNTSRKHNLPFPITLLPVSVSTRRIQFLYDGFGLRKQVAGYSFDWRCIHVLYGLCPNKKLNALVLPASSFAHVLQQVITSKVVKPFKQPNTFKRWLRVVNSAIIKKIIFILFESIYRVWSHVRDTKTDNK